MSPRKKIVSSRLFRISFRRDDGHLRASVSGYGGSLETTIAYWKAIGEEVREARPLSVLVVDELDGPPIPAQQVPAFIDAMSIDGFVDLRVAFVEAHLDQLAQAEGAEILAREKGFNVRVFANEMAASVWLRHGEI